MFLTSKFSYLLLVTGTKSEEPSNSREKLYTTTTTTTTMGQHHASSQYQVHNPKVKGSFFVGIKIPFEKTGTHDVCWLVGRYCPSLSTQALAIDYRIHTK
jgi:hypothetical protein